MFPDIPKELKDKGEWVPFNPQIKRLLEYFKNMKRHKRKHKSNKDMK